MVFAHARRPASRDPPGRSKDCLQKRSSPYIRKVQHTVLSVAGLKGTMSEAELHVLRGFPERANDVGLIFFGNGRESEDLPAATF